MGAGGTIPFDPELEAAKAALSHRAAPLYNKGGPQLLTDADIKEMQAGSLRRR